MSKVVELETRKRFVTKGVMEKIDNFTQHNIWTRIIDKLKVKAEDLIELQLIKCDICNQQAVSVKDTDGSFNDCWFAPEMVNEELLVIYDSDNKTEFMMLKSEAASLAGN